MLRLVDFDRSSLQAHRRLYLSAFPRCERFPWSMLRHRAEKGSSELLTLDNDGENVGFAYVITDDRLAYLFFFAVREDCRGMGLGTETIKLLLKRYNGKRFFIALESLEKTAPNYDERVRRHNFYLSCGLVDLPFRIQEASMIYSAMGAGCEIRPAEYISLMDSFFGKTLRKILRIKMINQQLT
ncbi:MAG: GNAT family N-acetyltransferase [Clostridiales bacterium]|nr:GNAT family N-acetyltransferase [Clostridiales bacterium]